MYEYIKRLGFTVLGLAWRCAGCSQDHPAKTLAYQTAVTGKTEHYCPSCCGQD